MSATATAQKKTVEKASTPAAAEPKAKEAFRLDALNPLEVDNLRWRLTAPEGIEPADLESGALWATCGAKKLRSFDVVEVVGFGGVWWAEVLVVEAQQTRQGCRTRLKLLRVVDVEPVEGGDAERLVPAGHEIRFDPQTQLYTAYRIRDNVPLSSQCYTREEAFRQLVDHATLRTS